MNLESIFGSNPIIANAAITFLKNFLKEQGIKTVVLRFDENAPEESQFEADMSKDKCVVMSEESAAIIHEYIKSKEHDNDDSNNGE